jgi:acetyl esterase/lipase
VINRRAFLGAAAGLTLPTAVVAKAAVTTVDYGPSKLDIHDPAPGKRLPVMLYVHGGAWQVGSRKDVDAKPTFFRDLGYLFVSADYRLGPFNKPDRQEADVAALIVGCGRISLCTAATRAALSSWAILRAAILSR